MPAHPATHDWEAVKATAIATGSLRDAAGLHGVSLAAVRQRAHRDDWPSPNKIRMEAAKAQEVARVVTARARRVRSDESKAIVTNVIPAIVTTSEALETHMRTTREEFQTHAATAIRNATRHAASLDGPDALDKSRKIADIVQSGVKLHGLGTPETQVAVQVLNQW